jgi:tetratricopeptide (TPR) repeat protein
MIHGDADNNPGTFTLQSERLFAAIKGLGGTARLVLLPQESHGYSAKENVLHMLWEQDEWLKKYCPNNEEKSTGSINVPDEKLKATENKYQESIATGDGYFTAREFSKAIHFYQSALSLKQDDSIALNKIKDSEMMMAEQKKLDEDYKSSISAGDMAFGKKDYDVARKYYSQAAALKPTEKYPKDKMAEAEKLKAEQE